MKFKRRFLTLRCLACLRALSKQIIHSLKRGKRLFSFSLFGSTFVSLGSSSWRAAEKVLWRLQLCEGVVAPDHSFSGSFRSMSALNLVAFQVLWS